MQSTSDQRSIWSFRLCIVLLTAVSVSLPIAWISLAKVLLFITGLWCITASILTKSQPIILRNLWTTRAILVIVIAFASSLFWTDVDFEFATQTFVKHAKLLGVLLIIFLIRSEREARMVMAAFATGQVFILINSWLLSIGVIAPWISNHQEFLATKNVVFAESYIDQSIMFTATAVVIWYLGSDYLRARWLPAFIAVAALLDVFFLLPGRTGYVAALATIVLAIMWAISGRLRIVVLVAAPLIVTLSLLLSTGQVHNRVFEAIHEVQNNSQHTETESSSGWRLNAWRRSVQVIDEKPWIGYGVGSWTMAVKRIEGSNATQIFGKSNSSNPHQEFLLWGVELGLGGVLLLLTMLISIAKDAWNFPANIRKATLSVVVIIAIACFFNSALFDDLMGDFLYVILGILMALGIQSTPPRKQSLEH